MSKLNRHKYEKPPATLSEKCYTVATENSKDVNDFFDFSDGGLRNARYREVQLNLKEPKEEYVIWESWRHLYFDRCGPGAEALAAFVESEARKEAKENDIIYKHNGIPPGYTEALSKALVELSKYSGLAYQHIRRAPSVEEYDGLPGREAEQGVGG